MLLDAFLLHGYVACDLLLFLVCWGHKGSSKVHSKVACILCFKLGRPVAQPACKLSKHLSLSVITTYIPNYLVLEWIGTFKSQWG